MAVDALYWAETIGLVLSSLPMVLKGREYQKEVWRTRARLQCYQKGAQLGFTEINVVKTLHGMVYGRYPKGSLYLFPTREDVIDFSKGRFAPIIANNPEIDCHVSDTDAANIKKVAGAMLYLRGAKSRHKAEGIKKTASQLKSIPVDRLVFDEVDEMEYQMIDLARHRLDDSDIKEEIYLSTPMIPDSGIDLLYQQSDQRVWLIRCEHCNHDTCLELEFPNCLQRRDDHSVYRKCIKCGKEIFPKNGRWIPRIENREMEGYWISQLNSPKIDPKVILDEFENPPNGNLAEVYNSRLGMAYVAAENRLTVNDIYNICGPDAMLTQHEGPTCMGVDVKGYGHDLHVAIAHHPNETSLKADKFVRVRTFNDVHDLAKRFNVASAVVNLEPETRKAREFQENESYEVFLAHYEEHQRHSPAFDSKSGLVKMNRTELCDASHDLVKTPGRYSVPRRNEEVERYALEMSNIAKVLEEDPDTGSSSYRYRKLGPEDYRHATNYMMLAAMRIGVYEPEFEKNRPKDGWDEGFKDKKSSSWMAT